MCETAGKEMQEVRVPLREEPTSMEPSWADITLAEASNKTLRDVTEIDVKRIRPGIATGMEAAEQGDRIPSESETLAASKSALPSTSSHLADFCPSKDTAVRSSLDDADRVVPYSLNDKVVRSDSSLSRGRIISHDMARQKALRQWREQQAAEREARGDEPMAAQDIVKGGTTASVAQYFGICSADSPSEVAKAIELRVPPWNDTSGTPRGAVNDESRARACRSEDARDGAQTNETLGLEAEAERADERNEAKAWAAATGDTEFLIAQDALGPTFTVREEVEAKAARHEVGGPHAVRTGGDHDSTEGAEASQPAEPTIEMTDMCLEDLESVDEEVYANPSPPVSTPKRLVNTRVQVMSIQEDAHLAEEPLHIHHATSQDRRAGDREDKDISTVNQDVLFGAEPDSLPNTEIPSDFAQPPFTLEMGASKDGPSIERSPYPTTASPAHDIGSHGPQTRIATSEDGRRSDGLPNQGQTAQQHGQRYSSYTQTQFISGSFTVHLDALKLVLPIARAQRLHVTVEVVVENKCVCEAVSKRISMPKSLATTLQLWDRLDLSLAKLSPADATYAVVRFMVHGSGRHGIQCLAISSLRLDELFGTSRPRVGQHRSSPLRLIHPSSTAGALAAWLWARVEFCGPSAPWSADAASRTACAAASAQVLRYSGRLGFDSLAIAPGWVWG